MYSFTQFKLKTVTFPISAWVSVTDIPAFQSCCYLLLPAEVPQAPDSKLSAGLLPLHKLTPSVPMTVILASAQHSSWQSVEAVKHCLKIVIRVPFFTQNLIAQSFPRGKLGLF